MQKKVFLLLVTSISFLFFTGCKKGKAGRTPDLATPISPEQILWSDSMAANLKNMQELGWTVRNQTEGKAVFAIPAGDEEKFKAADMQIQEVDEPYMVSIYFHDDRPGMVQISRRDSKEKIDSFENALLKAYGLTAPARTFPGTETTTPAGNKLSETRAIYESDRWILKLNKSHADFAEKKLATMPSDDLDVQVYLKEANRGISVEALAKGMENQ